MNRELWQQIHDLAVEGLGVRAIARRLAIHRRTVRAALEAAVPPTRASQNRGSIIDPYRGWLLARLEQYPELNAAVLCRQLAEKGYGGGYSLVKQCVADLRPRTKKAYLTLTFAPGECAQADWGVWRGLDVAGGRRRLSFFVMVLCHSRLMYAEFFLGESLEYWLWAHRHAFEAFGGVPERVMVDNCRTAVLTPRRAGAPPQFNPTYEDFARHYHFTISACNPGRPNEKGRVEQAVGYLKSSFLAGREPCAPEALNPALFDWTANVANRRVHGTTGCRPCDRFEQAERPALRPLPAGPHDGAAVTLAVADSRFRVTVDDNRYSVPSAAASRRVQVQRYPERIVIRTLEGDLLADHPRHFGRKQEIADPEHERALVLAMRHSRDRRRLTGFLTLGPDAAAYLAGLRDKRAAWRDHVDRINALAEVHGRDALARALADACQYGAFSAEYIHNLLEARARPLAEPGPLHVTRRADLLELQLPEPDLNLYEEQQP
jgi:transposase